MEQYVDNNEILKRSISEEEIDRILKEFNNTDADYDSNVTMHQLFEKQVVQTPNAIAIMFNNKTMSYIQLNNKANCIAHILREKGVGPDKVVGILAERSFEMIVGIFGILKAGGAYLPICPTNPIKRIDYMLKQSNVNFLLTHRKLQDNINFNGDIINLDSEHLYIDNKKNLPLINSSRNLAYIIFTSGSTGNPKGTMIEHRSLINRLNWMQKKYSINSNDVLIQKTPFGFDVSVWEIFWWSITGASLFLLDPGYEKYPQAIIEAVERKKITVIHFVPSMLSAFLNYVHNSNELQRLNSLKQVFCSGEALTLNHVKIFNETLYKYNKTRLTNLYGPTEATIDVTYFNCPKSNDINCIPIGKPIDNTKILILDNNQLLPIGEIGEICIAGDGLARGYLNQEYLTAEKFVNNPFIPGEKMYKTGDLGRWLPDGNIECLGRMDHQVKIRGLRIELEEIEQSIIKFGTSIECVVIAKKVSETIVKIIAFITSKEQINFDELKKYLYERLPEYMIPNSFIFLDNMPLSQNGKIDRKLLANIKE